MFSVVLIQLLAAGSCVYSIDLIQTDSVVVQPGQSLTITCQVSGYSLTDDNYATGWIRQREGKSMEWIFHRWGEGDFYQSNAKLLYHTYTSTSSVTLTGQNLQPEDTAVYYCCRLHDVNVRTYNLVKTTISYYEWKQKSGEAWTCQVSYSVGSYNTHWIRQPAGKGLEWIGAAHVGYASIYKDSLKNKFSISTDSSSNTVTLNGQNVQPEDSAVYYCRTGDISSASLSSQ
ncbi:uncharacterized protein [Trachinotus anak]|uniref:uncharacterized protein n=1 Tax=Trachinotus anak TaxID=443729 RepID=UPI0039F1C60B